MPARGNPQVSVGEDGPRSSGELVRFFGRHVALVLGLPRREPCLTPRPGFCSATRPHRLPSENRHS